MFFIADNSPQAIESAVRVILNLDEIQLKEQAQKAYDLVTVKKNWYVQTQRIYEFIRRN